MPLRDIITVSFVLYDCVDGNGYTISAVLYQTSHICAKTKSWLSVDQFGEYSVSGWEAGDI